jgi:predicted ATPase
VLDRALAETAGNGLAYWTAELHRRRGELLAAMSPDGDEAARACFSSAITVAQGQHARALELRAATSLARLELRRCDRRGALEHLERVAGMFSDGFDSRDIQEARAVLEEAGRAGDGRPGGSAAPPEAS